MFGVHPRARQLVGVERIGAAGGEALRGDARGARHLPAAGHQAEEAQERHRAGRRGARCLCGVGKLGTTRRIERGDARFEAAAQVGASVRTKAAPPSRASLRQTRSLAWMPVVPS